MSDWVSVSVEQLKADEPARKDRGHSFTCPKRIPWLRYCKHCGHVGLKNAISVLVTRIGCGYERDPRYVTWTKTGVV
jgi:hypothetical protein